MSIVLPIDTVMTYEPPYVEEGSPRADVDHESRLTQLLEGNRAGAVKYFMRDMVGAPAPIVAVLRLMPWIWRKRLAVTHTLRYDAVVMTRFRIPRSRFASIAVPAVVMSGAKTDPRRRAAASALSAVIPNVRYRELAGQTDNVSPKVLVPRRVHGS